MSLELITKTLALGLLAGTSLSAPTESQGFSVPARRASSGLNKRADSTASTDHVVVDFTFGGQFMPVALDSGSTFTYVASTLDNNKTETQGLPALFNPNISTTYHDENNPEDAYDCGGQQTECVMGLDDVATAGLAAQQMAFGVTSRLGPGTFSSGQAATMGFGRQSGDPTTWLPRDQTFWYRVGANLPSPYLFTVDIYGDRNGTFDFGYVDSNKYAGDITYGKIDTSMTNWNLNFTGYAIGKNNTTQTNVFTGVVDTGGPNIGLPSFIVNPYFESFGGAPSPGNSHNYPCSAYPPPDLTLQLQSGGTLVLNGTYLVNPPDGSSETCSGRLDDSQQTAYNLGASVLDQKFVVFDHQNERIGFADKASKRLGADTNATTTASSVVSTSTDQTTSSGPYQSPSSTAAKSMSTSSSSGEGTSAASSIGAFLYIPFAYAIFGML